MHAIIELEDELHIITITDYVPLAQSEQNYSCNHKKTY
jgi:hypothetical protein